MPRKDRTALGSRFSGSSRGATGGGGSDAEMRVGWRMAGLGFQVASEVGAGALFGWLFDRWQGTAPTGLLVGSIAGIAVARWSLIRGALKLNRELNRTNPVRTPRQEVSEWNESDRDDDEVDTWHEGRRSDDGRDDGE